MGQLYEYDSLEQDIITSKAKVLSAEPDREVLWGWLTGLGWTRVMLSRFTDNHHAVDITHWLANNIKYPYERNGADFLFQREQDADEWKDKPNKLPLLEE